MFKRNPYEDTRIVDDKELGAICDMVWKVEQKVADDFAKIEKRLQKLRGKREIEFTDPLVVKQLKDKVKYWKKEAKTNGTATDNNY